MTPRLICLVGLPGSGKSSWATQLVRLSKGAFVRINQDELGSRNKCEGALREAVAAGRSVILDRCNVTRTERALWARITSEVTQEIGTEMTFESAIVSFATSKRSCINNILKRSQEEAHPTIQSTDAEEVSKIVKFFMKRRQIPRVETERYPIIYTVRSRSGATLLAEHFAFGFPHRNSQEGYTVEESLVTRAEGISPL